MFQLTDKIIVVTGGNGLLGRSFITNLNKAGASVICADITTTGKHEHEIQLDITHPTSVQQCIGTILKQFGKIDGWINNAYPRTSDWGNKLEDIQAESWRKNVDMHMNGYFFCCQEILKVMKAQQRGSLINIASIYGLVGPDFSIYENTSMTMPAAYAAIKGGLINLTRYLASYYGVYKIRVNTISPGGIFDNQPESFVQNYEKKVPLKRLGTPEDIAPAAVFLMSDASSYITGQNIIIDGGWTCI